MDLHFEARMRHQQILEEAKTWRLLKLAKARPECGARGPVSRFIAWVCVQFIRLGRKPQMDDGVL